MKKFFNYLVIAAAAVFAASCEETTTPAEFEISAVTLAESAEFGASVDFTVTAAEASNVTVSLSYEGTILATETVRQANAGVFAGKIAIPYTKDIKDGAYSVLVMASGAGTDRAEKTLSINLSHPEFTAVALVAEGADKINLTKGEGNVWAFTGALPAVLKGYFEAKTASATYTFGGANLENVEFGSTEAVEIYEYENALTDATISFDVVSFAVKYPLNVKVVEVPNTTDVAYPGTIDVDFKKGQLVQFKNLGDLFVDVDFFDNNGDGTYTFRAEGAKYRLTNQSDWGLLRVERLNSTGGMAEFHWEGDKVTTNEAIWMIGNYNVGKPKIHSVRNGRVWTDWETFDALCMAKIDTYKYQITLHVTNMASYKFFQTKLNWGDIYGANYDLAKCNLNGLTNISPGPADNGNFLQSLSADPLTDPDAIKYPEEGVMIRFTFDVTNPNGIIVVAEDVTAKFAK